ncbi:unnamed protein product [Cochlearia groenlandica]
MLKTETALKRPVLTFNRGRDGYVITDNGCRPIERMEVSGCNGGSATASPCSSSQSSPSSSSFANLAFGDGHSLIPWLKHLSTTTSSSASSSSSSRLPNYNLYISAPVTPPLSSPTARTPRMNTDLQQISNSFFVSSTPPSPTLKNIHDSEWFSGIQLAQSIHASPTFSLVSRNPFGFKEDAFGGSGGCRGGSSMWTPVQRGTNSPAIQPGVDQTADVPMSETVDSLEFAFGSSNRNGLVKAWEGERIHEEWF